MQPTGTKIASRAAAAQLGKPGRKPHSHKRGRKLPPAILPVMEQNSPAYSEGLSEPCLLHRFVGEQGEIKATHLTKDSQVVKKLREGVAPPAVPSPAASTSTAAHFIGMIRSESILPMLDFDSDGCSSLESSGSRLRLPPVGVFKAGTPAPEELADAASRPTPEVLERHRQMLQAITPISGQAPPGDLNAYRFAIKEQADQLA